MPGGPERPLGPEPPSGSDPGDGPGIGPLIPAGSQPVPLPSLTSNPTREGVSVLAEGVEVFAANEQTALPVDTMRWVQLAQAVLVDEGVRGEAELSLLFVDEVAIADLNRRFLAKNGPTDVLAFPIDEEPVESGRNPDSGGTGPGFATDLDEAPVLLGDVVICPAVAARNAPEHAGTYDDELALLVVHGVLHLLGMDHLEDDEAEAMEARERELLARHHAPLEVSRADTSDGEATVRAAVDKGLSALPEPPASPGSPFDPDDADTNGEDR
jgi:probable rRNA maturation factor